MFCMFFLTKHEKKTIYVHYKWLNHIVRTFLKNPDCHFVS